VDWATGNQPGTAGGRITVREEDEGHVLYMTGDVDEPVVSALRREQGLADLRVVVVDVGELTYIDSTGLAWLVQWARDAESDGRAATIRGHAPNFDRVLYLAGLDALFVRV
jgi:anti-anti-sigma factor